MRLPRSRMTYMTADVSQWHYHKQLQNVCVFVSLSLCCFLWLSISVFCLSITHCQLWQVWRGSGGHAVFQHIIESGYNELNTDILWDGHGYG